MAKQHKFFTDVIAGVDRDHCVFYPMKDAANWSLTNLDHSKRVWIEIELPTDEELWPERCSGIKCAAKVVNIE